jgi:hypothetical protein
MRDKETVSAELTEVQRKLDNSLDLLQSNRPLPKNYRSNRNALLWEKKHLLGELTVLLNPPVKTTEDR